MLRLVWILPVLLLGLSGCIFAPTIDSIRRAGVTESSRMGLLPEQVKNYGESLYWGQPMQALGQVKDESRSVVADHLRKRAGKERVVEAKVQEVEFQDNAFKAKVALEISAFEVPFYIVNKRIENQTWEFSMTTGWQLAAVEDVEQPQTVRKT